MVRDLRSIVNGEGPCDPILSDTSTLPDPRSDIERDTLMSGLPHRPRSRMAQALSEHEWVILVSTKAYAVAWKTAITSDSLSHGPLGGGNRDAGSGNHSAIRCAIVRLVGKPFVENSCRLGGKFSNRPVLETNYFVNRLPMARTRDQAIVLSLTYASGPRLLFTSDAFAIRLLTRAERPRRCAIDAATRPRVGSDSHPRAQRPIAVSAADTSEQPFTAGRSTHSLPARRRPSYVEFRFGYMIKNSNPKRERTFE